MSVRMDSITEYDNLRTVKDRDEPYNGVTTIREDKLNDEERKLELQSVITDLLILPAETPSEDSAAEEFIVKGSIV